MKKSVFIFICILVLCSCSEDVREITFPSSEREFPPAQSRSYTAPKESVAEWKKVNSDPPLIVKTKFNAEENGIFSLKPFVPFKAPVDSSVLALESLPSQTFSFSSFPKRKTKPKIIFLGKPQKTKVQPPLTETRSVYGLMKMGQDQGLPGTSVTGIKQDKNGGLWVSTDNGFCYFDGEYIYTYTTHEGLSRDDKNSVCIDKSGHIWAGGAGVDILVPEKGIVLHYGKQEGLTSNSVGYVYQDSKNRIFICGTKGVDVFDPADSTVFHFGKEELPSLEYRVNRVLEDSAGRYFFSTQGGGLNIYEPAKEKIYNLNKQHGLRSSDITALHSDTEGRLWFGGWYCDVHCYDIKNSVLYKMTPEKHGIAKPYMFNITQDFSGYIWVGYLDCGADRIDFTNRTIQHIYGGKGESSKNTVYTLFEDKNKCMWLGCNFAGLVKYDPSNGMYVNYESKFSFSNEAITCIYEDGNKDIWLCSAFNGIGKIDHTTGLMSSLEFINGNWDLAYYAHLLDDGRNRMFIGSAICFNVWDKKREIMKSWRYGGTRCMQLTKNGVLFGTGKGLMKYDTLSNEFFRLNASPDSLTVPVECMTKDGDGNIWIGTTDGIYVLNEETNRLKKFGKEQGFGKTTVSSIITDHNNNIWAGTVSKGLLKIDPKNKSVTHFTKQNGLAEMTVLSLVEKNNSVYAGTVRGLSVINETPRGVEIKNAGKAQGLRAIDFNPDAAVAANDGTIWWGAGDIITNYHPPAFINNSPGQTSLTSVDVMGKVQYFTRNSEMKKLLNNNDTVWSAAADTFYLSGALPPDSGYLQSSNIKWDSTSGIYEIPVALQLPYDHNHLTFHFTGNYISNIDKTRYRYILEGIDRKWNSSVASPFAEYRNIPPGTYVFKVCSNNNSSGWSKPAIFQFTVNPPWWKTKIAYALYAVSLFASVIGYARMRTASLVRKQKELEGIVQDRTKEILSQKNEIEKQKQVVEERQKEILDSIKYAKRIQAALLTNERYIHRVLGKLKKK